MNASDELTILNGKVLDVAADSIMLHPGIRIGLPPDYAGGIGIGQRVFVQARRVNGLYLAESVRLEGALTASRCRQCGRPLTHAQGSRRGRMRGVSSRWISTPFASSSRMRNRMRDAFVITVLSICLTLSVACNREPTSERSGVDSRPSAGHPAVPGRTMPCPGPGGLDKAGNPCEPARASESASPSK